MASEAVVPFVVRKLGDLLIQEAQLLHGVHDQFEWIKTELNRMQCFLKDADSRQKEDEGVRNWVAEIINASYAAEDVIDIFIYSQRRRRGFVGRVKRYIFIPSELRTRHKVAKKIERIRLKISDITRKQKRLMASEAVVPFVVQKLGDLLIQEAQLLHEVHDKFEWIQTELKRMRCFLKDADSRQKEDEVVKNWVAEIINASYDAEDVIDIFIYNRRRRRGFVERVQRYICIVSELRTRHKVAKKIDRIKAKISDITRSRETYGIRDINEGRQEESSSSQSLQQRRRRLALLEETEVVGQQEGINTVKEQLMSTESRRCVISIIGMGGLGKTTLAKKVYYDVKHNFDCHAFVYLSQQFGIKDVLMRILKCVMGLSRDGGEKLNEDELGMRLRDHLREKRYLLVIDDIWSTQAWDTLKLVLPIGMNKSRVMLTTRVKDVALHADPSSHPHEMRLLNDDEGWELLMKNIFPEGDPSTACPPELEKTGRKILAKCRGLPLAILVLGGLLSRKDKTFTAWSKVLESVNRYLTESSNQCRDILALSYWDLPYYLKPCFLYLGLFPEDHEIDSVTLINMWIAEGFIPQKDDSIVEDVAEDYLEELVGRSMIQAASKEANGSIGSCRIHDLLRDLSISEATQNNFFTLHNDNGTSSSSTSVRRLALYENIDGYNEHINRSIATLRSILWFSDYKEDHSPLLLIPSGKLLRVFDGFRAEILREATGDGEFFNLRYLKIYKFASTKSLSSFIGNLSNLLALEISLGCILPNAIWNLEELRHLDAFACSVDGHPQLNNLRNLQSLSLGAGSWINDDLGKLTNLRRLTIWGDISSYHKALSESVEKLCNLRALYLFNGHSIPPFMPFTHHLYLYRMILDGRIEKLHVLPPNLAELRLCESKLEQDVISTLEKLPHLKYLQLWWNSYDSKKMFCSSGGFPRLEELELRDLPLEEWIVEEGAMPSLKSVGLLKMPNLKTLPEQICVLSKWI
ncbi:putative disease resistance protein [Cinnamomum micranthum f. kanehirae]|uniref:Putative disease resistance protein n=1 Tax=Cinnamomum micranthum f. kanehirae TaxID=337451 RepID=A0A3S3MQP6_9MAGN|nr:putative disease resistance protein [Cinnamomum micranthum f. kanehirae]